MCFGFVDAFDTEQLVETLSKLKSGQSVQVPTYDFKLHQRSSDRSRQVHFLYVKLKSAVTDLRANI